MNVHLPVQYDASGKAQNKGMDRFFSSTNIDRYRSLAGGKIDAIERRRVLKALAHEWGAFTRGCRTPGATSLRPSPDVIFRNQGSI